MATDAELNQFLGMKHYAPYRHGSGVGSAGRGMRDRLKELKTRLATRKWGEVPEEENASGSRSSRPQDQGWGNKTGGNKSGEPKKKRKGKKERQREAATGGEDGTATGSAEKRSAPIADGEGPSKKRKL
jgi:protein KRI1